MLTNAAVKAARPQARAYKLADAGGLYLLVAPTGLRSWRLKYRANGVERLLVLGRYPDMTLIEARDRRDDARRQLRAGIDPAVARRAPPAVEHRTFEAAARRWHDDMRGRWSTKHADDVIGSLERFAFPRIGNMVPTAITSRQVLDVVRAAEDAGRHETARRLRQRMSAIFAREILDGNATADPAAIVRRALAPAPIAREHRAITDLDELRALVAAADTARAAPAVRRAATFLALTAVRMDALRGARWREIEALDDDDNVLWRVPAARMKLSRAKKGDGRFDHLVPLSRQAASMLRAVHGSAANDELIFGGRLAGRPIGENAIAALYQQTAFAGRHVPHGWRASFSTILNEAYPDHARAIDMALAHAPAGKSKVEGAYNRAQLLGQRRILFQAWADMILPG